MPAPTWLTETDYCPLTGDRPDEAAAGTRVSGRRAVRNRMVPVRYLPAGSSDVAAERARAAAGASHWSRRPDGSVVLWMELN